MMTKKELRADWLNWFKLAVRQAASARLEGDIDSAMRLDSTVEAYYREKHLHDYCNDQLHEVESTIRANIRL